MARKPVLFGFARYPNVISFASTILYVDPTNAVATLPASNLKTEEPSEVCRVTTIYPTSAFWRATIIPRTLGAMALVNLNVSPGAFVRFLGSRTGPILTSWLFLSPNAIAASSNATGAVTNVDDIDPDSLFIDPTTTSSDWWVRFSFPTPATTPGTGANRTIVFVRAILSGTALHYPVLTASLYESGSLVRSLGSRAVSVSTGDGQLFFFTFDAAELADPTMANAEVRLDFTPGDNNSGGTPNRYARLNSVHIMYDRLDAHTQYDSGMIEVPGSDYIDPEFDPSPSISIDYFPPTPWEDVVTLLATVVDDQTFHDPPRVGASSGDFVHLANMVDAGTIINQPSGYVQAGVFAAGPALTLERSPRLGPESSVVVEGYEGTTEGGQTYGADAFRYRRMSANLLLNRTEKDELLSGVDWRRGRSGAFYVNLDPDLAADNKEFTAGWVTVAEAGVAVQLPGIAYDAGDLMLYEKSYVFEEKL